MCTHITSTNFDERDKMNRLDIKTSRVKDLRIQKGFYVSLQRKI